MFCVLLTLSFVLLLCTKSGVAHPFPAIFFLALFIIPGFPHEWLQKLHCCLLSSEPDEKLSFLRAREGAQPLNLWVRSAAPEVPPPVLLWVNNLIKIDAQEPFLKLLLCVNILIKACSEECFESCFLKPCVIMVFYHRALQMTNHLSCSQPTEIWCPFYFIYLFIFAQKLLECHSEISVF